jgi:hypothetical protein
MRRPYATASVGMSFAGITRVARHPERLEDVPGDVVRILLSGRGLHDVAREPDRDVRVFPLRLRWQREPHPVEHGQHRLARRKFMSFQ